MSEEEDATSTEKEAELTLVHTHKWGTGFFLIVLSLAVFAVLRYFEIELPGQAHFLVSFFLFLAGLVLVAYRSGVTLDREDKLAYGWRSVFGIKMAGDEVETAQDAVIHLSVRVKKRVVEDERVDVRLYKLEVERGEERVFLDEIMNAYNEAQQACERYAKFLWIPAVDSTSGERVERPPSEIDESLAVRLKRTGEFPESVGDDIDAVILSQDGPVSRFVIPSRMRFFQIVTHVFSLALWGGGAGAAGYLFVGETHEILRPVWLGLLVIASGLLLKALYQIVKDATHREVVIVTSKTFTVESRWLLWSTEDKCALDHLEEIQVNTESGERLREFDGLRARTDDDTIDFGDYLRLDDRIWLRDALHHIIATQES